MKDRSDVLWQKGKKHYLFPFLLLRLLQSLLLLLIFYQFIPKTPWNYGFSVDEFEINYNAVGNIPFSQNNPPITIKAKMQQIYWGLKFPYRSVCRKNPKSRTPISDVREIELCPYGCARLRMTEMPLLGK